MCFTGFLARLGRLVRRPRSTTPTQDTGACHRIIPDETELTSRSGSRKQAKCLIIADEQGRGKKIYLSVAASLINLHSTKVTTPTNVMAVLGEGKTESVCNIVYASRCRWKEAAQPFVLLPMR
jgi:hypothetical protein